MYVYGTLLINLELIINKSYWECLGELRQYAAKETKELKSPVLRYLQIEERLNKTLRKTSSKKECGPETAVQNTVTNPRISEREPSKCVSQREVFKSLIKEYGWRKEIVVRKYAELESRGIVRRRKDGNNFSPLQYADALYRDAEKKGWASK